MQLLNIPKELTTKGDRAEYLYGNDEMVATYDCAVPMQWARKVNERLPDLDADIARHVVTVYYKNRSTRIMPITDYGLKALCTYATYA